MLETAEKILFPPEPMSREIYSGMHRSQSAKKAIHLTLRYPTFLAIFIKKTLFTGSAFVLDTHGFEFFCDG